MFRLAITIVICVLAKPMCAKIAPLQESLAEKLDKLVEKVEKFTISPVTERADSLYAKLDRLNSLNPERVEWPGDGLTDEEEELLSAMQQWGAVSPEQLAVLAKDLQEMREQPPVINDKLPEDEVDDLWGEDFQDIQDDIETNYAMDGGEDWDTDEEEISTLMPRIQGQHTETSSEIPRITAAGFRPGVLMSSFIDPIAATAERPRIIDDSSMTLVEQMRLKKSALANMGKVVRAAKCLRPQPRWLPIRQLAPAADSIYMPPCVELHRCAPDSGCCDNEAEFCAPIEGKYVSIPLFIRKSNGNLTVSRMLFYNHTSCACISRDSPREPILRINTPEPEIEIERDDEPANLRTTVRDLRCTCPRLFQAKIENGTCTCSCSWTESVRRRECLSLARGREHFGLRDRVCLSRGDCTVPTCEYGSYEITSGRCPLRKYRRVKYHWKTPRYHDKN